MSSAAFVVPVTVCDSVVTATVSFREVIMAALVQTQYEIISRCAGRPIVIAAAPLLKTGGRNTHGVPVIAAVGADDDWSYPIAEIAMGKLKISAVTRLSSQEVEEGARLQISGFPYYGSTVFRCHPDFDYWGVVAASGLSDSEDEFVTTCLATAVQSVFEQSFNELQQVYPDVSLGLVA